MRKIDKMRVEHVSDEIEKRMISDGLDLMKGPSFEITSDRPSCLKCVRKHLSQAHALLCEMKKGYPEHYFFAIGHMAEAEDECVMDHPGLAAYIRNLRMQLEADAEFAKAMPWETIASTVTDAIANE